MLNITAAVAITDQSALHAHALQLAVRDGGLHLSAAEDLLGTAQKPDLSACLRLVFRQTAVAPGVETLNVVVEKSGAA